MDPLQLWLVVGVPGLVAAAALFVGRSRLRAWIGYAVLVALVAAFAVTPGGVLSAAAIGAIVVVLVANGRGTYKDATYREHHEDRRRFTTTGDVNPPSGTYAGERR